MSKPSGTAAIAKIMEVSSIPRNSLPINKASNQNSHSKNSHNHGEGFAEGFQADLQKGYLPQRAPVGWRQFCPNSVWRPVLSTRIMQRPVNLVPMNN